MSPLGLWGLDNRRLDVVLTLVAISFLVASRFALLASGPWEWDETIFARGMLHFELAAHFPHPPGFPGWLAYIVTFAEIGGGALLLAGVAVRAVSIALLPVLLGATFVHFGSGWVFSNPNGGWEYPAFLSLAAVVQALLGPGRFAVRLPQRTAETATA